jgi:hypothetical protein
VSASGQIRRWVFLSVLGGGILIQGCAKSIAPPGGPIDRTPPKVIGSIPPSGVTNLALDSRLIIQFSEPIGRRNPDQSVFISPQVDPPPKIAVKGDRLEIRFPGGLKPGKTYVVTLGSDLKDAHAVNLAQSVNLAFATGPTIDSGSISGTVFDNGKTKAGISLALFEKMPDETIPVDSLIPDYITQSGKDGKFSFNYLPPKQYHLIAFDDRRKNRRINPSQEMIGIPFKSTAMDSARAVLTGVNIQMVPPDTAEIGMKSVTFNTDGLVKARFNRKLPNNQAGTLFRSITIRAVDGDSLALGLMAFTPMTPYPAADFLLLTELPVSGKTYQIRFDQKVIYPAVVDSLRYLIGDFTATPTADIAPPMLLETSPADKASNVVADSLFFFRFSEPLDTVGLQQAVRTADTLGDTFSVALTPVDPFAWSGRPAEPLVGGRGYTLLVTAPAVRDRAGNRLGDSTVRIQFATIDPSTLGQVSGDIRFTSISDTGAPVVLTFVPAGQGTRREATVAAGGRHYLIDLLPGYYTINAYVDINGDGSYGSGAIVPFRPAEPFTARPDTIRVRSRFESAGVLVEF